MDLIPIVSEFIEDALGATSSYGLTHIGDLDSSAEAAAVIRLRLALYGALLAEGWTPSPEVRDAMARDELLLLEPDLEETMAIADSTAEDHAVIRARARRVRAEARQTSDMASDRRAQVEQMRVELAQMREAIDSRAVIEQAKGIAMERYGLNPETAWAWLVRTSQQTNRKLRIVAQEIVASSTAASSNGQHHHQPTPAPTPADGGLLSQGTPPRR